MNFAVFNSKRRDSRERIVFVWALNVDGSQHFGGKRRVHAKYFSRRAVESHEKPKSKKQVARDSISPHNFNISKINIMYKNKISGTFLPLFTVPLTICDDQ